eukprot:8345290-Alexandrium_andersonii.AAC.1
MQHVTVATYPHGHSCITGGPSNFHRLGAPMHQSYNCYEHHLCGKKVVFVASQGSIAMKRCV